MQDRKLVEELAFYVIFLMHRLAIAVGGESFLFTANSGTGKSTHQALARMPRRQRNNDK